MESKLSDEQQLDRIKKSKSRRSLLEFIKYTNPQYDPNWHHEIICEKLDEFMRDPDKSRLMVFVGPRRGKALALDTPIFTTKGWSTIGELKVGDKVFGKDGKPCNVVAKSEIFKDRECYEITVNPKNGTHHEKLVADSEHVWNVRLNRKRKSFTNHTTQEIFENKGDGRNKLLPKNNAVSLPYKKLPIHPWLLGYWLGNGNSYGANITTWVKDFDEVKSKIESLGYDLENITRIDEKSCYTFTVKGLHKLLTENNLIRNKHVPERYKLGSIEQRENLVGGLIDSDGSVDPESSRIKVSFSNKKLANDTVDLIRSLGTKVSCNPSKSGYVNDEGEYVECKTRYIIGLYRTHVSALERKCCEYNASVYSNNFIKGERLEYLVDTQCIQVDSPDSLFLVGRTFIPTHNSEIVSRRFPAYYFGHNPDGQVIATSYGAELAQAMNRDVQRVIDSPQYQALFPKTQLSGKNIKTTSLGNYIRTSDKFEIVGRRGAYRSAGVGGGITGMGADLAIIDDPLKDMAEAMSPKRKSVVWDWYTSTLYTRLSKVGKVIIILTRWAEDDLAGRLLKEAKVNGDADQWDVLCFPEEYDPDHPYVSDEDPREEKGEILWPEWFPEEKVKKTKASVGSKVWSSLFQQSPSPDGGAIFKSHWFQYFKETPDFEYICSSWDCAFKDSASSDFVAGGVWGVAGANKYLLYLIRERLSFVNTVKEMLRVRNKYPNMRFMLVEDKANGPAVVSTLKNKIPGLITYNPKESKESRANAVSPQYEAGNIWLPDKYYEPNRSRYSWCVKGLDDYIEEHKNFPNGGNDDTVDMTTQLLLKVGNSPSWLDELANGSDGKPLSPEDRRSIEYEDRLKEMMGWSGAGESQSGLPFNLNF